MTFVRRLRDRSRPGPETSSADEGVAAPRRQELAAVPLPHSNAVLEDEIGVQATEPAQCWPGLAVLGAQPVDRGVAGPSPRAAYIAAQSLYVVMRGEQPAVSLAGIAWTAVTCLVMRVLHQPRLQSAGRSVSRSGSRLQGSPTVHTGRTARAAALGPRDAAASRGQLAGSAPPCPLTLPVAKYPPRK